MRVLRLADGDALQNLVAYLPNRAAHRHGEIVDDAEPARERNGLSRIHPERGNAGKSFARGAGAVTESNPPRNHQGATGENHFVAWRTWRGGARSRSSVKFIALIFSPSFSSSISFRLLLRGRRTRTIKNMKDLSNPFWIKLKGLLFLFID